MSGVEQADPEAGGAGEDIKEAASSQEQNSEVKPEPASRQKNLHRIQQRKLTVLGLPQEEKLLKLALYSKCQV